MSEAIWTAGQPQSHWRNEDDGSGIPALRKRSDWGMFLSPWRTTRDRPWNCWVGKGCLWNGVLSLSLSDSLTQVWHQTSNWFAIKKSDRCGADGKNPTRAIEDRGSDWVFHRVQGGWTLWWHFRLHCCSIQLCHFSPNSTTLHHMPYWCNTQSHDTKVLNRHSTSAFWEQTQKKMSNSTRW